MYTSILTSIHASITMTYKTRRNANIGGKNVKHKSIKYDSIKSLFAFCEQQWNSSLYSRKRTSKVGTCVLGIFCHAFKNFHEQNEQTRRKHFSLIKKNFWSLFGIWIEMFFIIYEERDKICCETNNGLKAEQDGELPNYTDESSKNLCFNRRFYWIDCDFMLFMFSSRL